MRKERGKREKENRGERKTHGLEGIHQGPRTWQVLVLPSSMVSICKVRYRYFSTVLRSP